MKGLLLKDFYMARRYCWPYLLIAVLFIGISAVTEYSVFYVFYPGMLAGMVPSNLLVMDERSKWEQYSGVLPYTKTQLVTAKYLIGLFMQASILVMLGAVQAVRMHMAGAFIWNDFLVLLLLLSIASYVSTSIVLPFMFIWGAEKGRIAYFAMLGLFVACIAGVTNLINTDGSYSLEALPSGWMLALVCAVGVALYVLTWYLSIAFYRKRDGKA